MQRLKKRLYIIDVVAVVVILCLIEIVRLIYQNEEDPDTHSKLWLNISITICFFLMSALMVIFATRIGLIVKQATNNQPKQRLIIIHAVNLFGIVLLYICD